MILHDDDVREQHNRRAKSFKRESSHKYSPSSLLCLVRDMGEGAAAGSLTTTTTTTMKVSLFVEIPKKKKWPRHRVILIHFNVSGVYGNITSVIPKNLHLDTVRV